MTLPPGAEGRLVVVEWEDADEMAGWREAADVAADAVGNPTLVWSVGFVFQETEERITLVQSVTRDGMGSQHRIPNGMIRSVRRLTIGQEA